MNTPKTARLSPKAHLDQLKIAAKKKLGQCFLHDPMVISRIVESIPNDDLSVVEVGPGLGALTVPLLALKRSVVAIDRDPDMIDAIEALIREILPEASARLETMCADILAVDLTDLAMRTGSLPTKRIAWPIHVVGNLPYNISSQIIFQLLASRQVIQTATIMIQKELADRLVAKPGSKQYGIPTVLCAQYADIRVVVQAASGAFYPPPRVDSTVLQLDFRPVIQHASDAAQLAQVVKAAFAARRKTIRRSLALKYKLQDIEVALDIASIDPRVRAESLPLAAFIRLARALPKVI